VRWTLWIVLMLLPTTVSARKWTDRSGGSSVEAEYRGMEGGVVLLENRGGKAVRVPLDKLSPRDQEYVWARRTLRSLTGAAGLENLASVAQDFHQAVAEFAKSSAAAGAETDVKRDLARAERRTDLDATLAKICDGFARKPLTIVFPITNVRRAKYVPNPQPMIPGRLIIGPRWLPAGPDDYELLLGPPKGQYGGEIKGPGILNVKLSQDQVLSIGRDSFWVYSGTARLKPGVARLSEGRLWVEHGEPPLAALVASAKGNSAVSGGILIYLDTQRIELKHGADSEEPADAKSPGGAAKKAR